MRAALHSHILLWFRKRHVKENRSPVPPIPRTVAGSELSGAYRGQGSPFQDPRETWTYDRPPALVDDVRFECDARALREEKPREEQRIGKPPSLEQHGLLRSEPFLCLFLPYFREPKAPKQPSQYERPKGPPPAKQERKLWPSL